MLKQQKEDNNAPFEAKSIVAIKEVDCSVSSKFLDVSWFIELESVPDDCITIVDGTL